MRNQPELEKFFFTFDAHLARCEEHANRVKLSQDEQEQCVRLRRVYTSLIGILFQSALPRRDQIKEAITQRFLVFLCLFFTTRIEHTTSINQTVPCSIMPVTLWMILAAREKSWTLRHRPLLIIFPIVSLREFSSTSPARDMSTLSINMACARFSWP